MKKYILGLFIFSCVFCNAQEVLSNDIDNSNKKSSMSSYINTVNQANKLYENKKYLESALKYEEAFENSNGKAIWVHLYSTAVSYAMANIKDKAFNYLFKSIDKTNCISIENLKNDKDLISLHSDPQWNDAIEKIKLKEQATIKSSLDKNLVKKLEVIMERDQKYRRVYDDLVKKHGRESSEMKKIIKEIKTTDSLNLVEVTEILDTRGWLGKEVIGNQGNTTLFLVIQHSDLNTQIKYLPMLKDAVKKGNAHASFLALLEDRTALKQGKKQIYGSQIAKDKKTGNHYVSPLIDPENVDKRRAEVGLGTLSDYVSRWDIIWDVKKHKAMIKKLETEKK